MPNDPLLLDLAGDPVLRAFACVAYAKDEDEYRLWYEEAMGISFSAEAVHLMGGTATARGGEKDVRKSRVRVPLSIGIKPDLVKSLKNMVPLPDTVNPQIAGGSYTPGAKEKVFSMSNLAKDEFYRKFAIAGVLPATVVAGHRANAGLKKKEAPKKTGEDNTSQAEAKNKFRMAIPSWNVKKKK